MIKPSQNFGFNPTEMLWKDLKQPLDWRKPVNILEP